MITFNPPLVKAIFVKRFKRFFIEVEYENQLLLAHIANTGSMLSLLNSGAEVLMQYKNDPKRKLAYSIEAIKHDGIWVGVNTMQPNRLIKKALLEHDSLLKDYSYTKLTSEVKYGVNLDSKIDFLLENNQKKHFLEIKNVTLKQDNKALFPDSVSLRAQKHVHELMAEIKKGHQASLLFVVQRNDIQAFGIAQNIDPNYYDLVVQASKKGLQLKAISALINENKLCLVKELPINL